MKLNDPDQVDEAVLVTAAALVRDYLTAHLGDLSDRDMCPLDVPAALYRQLDERGAVAAAKALEAMDHTTETDKVLDVIGDLAKHLTDQIDVFVEQRRKARQEAREQVERRIAAAPDLYGATGRRAW